MNGRFSMYVKYSFQRIRSLDSLLWLEGVISSPTMRTILNKETEKGANLWGFFISRFTSISDPLVCCLALVVRYFCRTFSIGCQFVDFPLRKIKRVLKGEKKRGKHLGHVSHSCVPNASQPNDSRLVTVVSSQQECHFQASSRRLSERHAA